MVDVVASSSNNALEGLMSEFGSLMRRFGFEVRGCLWLLFNDEGVDEKCRGDSRTPSKVAAAIFWGHSISSVEALSMVKVLRYMRLKGPQTKDEDCFVFRYEETENQEHLVFSQWFVSQPDEEFFALATRSEFYPSTFLYI